MLARSTGGTRPACFQSAAGAGRTASERKSSELSWVIGTSMRSGWPNADTMRECPKPAAYEVEHASNAAASAPRSEEHTSELQSLMRISYAVFCLKKKKTTTI